jgi:hypothetical protein
MNEIVFKLLSKVRSFLIGLMLARRLFGNKVCLEVRDLRWLLLSLVLRHSRWLFSGVEPATGTGEQNFSFAVSVWFEQFLHMFNLFVRILLNWREEIALISCQSLVNLISTLKLRAMLLVLQRNLRLTFTHTSNYLKRGLVLRLIDILILLC